MGKPLDENPTTIATAFASLLLSLIAISIVCALVAFIIYLIPITAGISITEAKNKIQRNECGCQCFDRLYKGTYGGDQYRAVYFNYDKETVLLLFITAIYLFVLHAFVKRILRLLVCGRLNWLAVTVFGLNVYQMNYDWWATW